MPDAPPIVAGFNHTVKHGGKAFHVQTEDSGANSPRLVTHLFLGGNILASKRTDYAELLGAAQLPALVKELMEEQHKEVLRNLVAGVYDGTGDPAAAATAWQPGELEVKAAPTSPPAIFMRAGAANPLPSAEREGASTVGSEAPAAGLLPSGERESMAPQHPSTGCHRPGHRPAGRRSWARRAHPLLPGGGRGRPLSCGAPGSWFATVVHRSSHRLAPPAAQPVIQLFHVHKQYGDEAPALRDLTFSVAKGEFVFVTGPSGAGKSTLMRLVLCAEPVTSGQLVVLGRNVSRLKASGVAQLRRSIGVVFQDFKLLPDRTVDENVAFPLEVRGASPRELRQKVGRVLGALDLAPKAGKLPPSLSGGEQQRVAVARALVAEPELLLADEPTGNLDPERTVEVMDLLHLANARGTTVVVATHDRFLLERYRRRVVALNGGRLARDTPPSRESRLAVTRALRTGLYFVRRALYSMARGPRVALAATLTVAVAVLVTGLFTAVLRGGERLLSGWAGEVRLSVYLDEGADLGKAVLAARAAAPGRAVEGVTSAEAVRRFRTSLGPQAALLDGLGDDLLPPSVEVAAPGIGLEAARALARRLEAIPGAREVDYGNAWVERLEHLLGRLRWAGLALLGALGLGAAVLVANTLRLGVFARRDEIAIMKLVGATDRFVEAPFLVEGLLEGALGGILAVVALHLAAAWGLARLALVMGLARSVSRADLLPLGLTGALVGGGAAIGLVASALAVSRELRRR